MSKTLSNIFYSTIEMLKTCLHNATKQVSFSQSVNWGFSKCNIINLCVDKP